MIHPGVHPILKKSSSRTFSSSAMPKPDNLLAHMVCHHSRSALAQGFPDATPQRHGAIDSILSGRHSSRDTRCLRRERSGLSFFFDLTRGGVVLVVPLS